MVPIESINTYLPGIDSTNGQCPNILVMKFMIYLICSTRFQAEQKYAPVWGCAWNLIPFSWAILICYSFLICPTNSWPLEVWMLSVLKLVSPKSGASGELDLRPQGLRSFKCSKLILGQIWFLNKPEVWRAVNLPRMIGRECGQHQLIKLVLMSASIY